MMKRLLSIITFCCLGFSVSRAQPCTQSVGAFADSPVCSGRQLKLHATTVTGASYSWTGPGGFTSTGQHPVRNNMSILESGNYIVTATVGSCVYKDTAFIIVDFTPAKPAIIHNLPICFDDTLKMWGTSNLEAKNLHWWGPNGFNIIQPSPQEIKLFHPVVGTYYVTQASQAGCVSDTNSVFISFFPTIPLSASVVIKSEAFKPVEFRAKFTGGGITPKFQWLKNGMAIPGATDSIYTAVTGVDIQVSDKLCVWVKPFPACDLDSILTDCVAISPLSVNNLAVSNGLHLYPNPGNGHFTLVDDALINGGNIEVFNSIGQKVYEVCIPKGNKNYELNIFAPDGVYLLKLRTYSSTKYSRLVIAR
jgi:hypothetical protein